MINIFVGTSDNHDTFIERILVYTLHKNSSEPLNIRFLRPRDFPNWDRSTWGTPFTCFRYVIPHLMGYKGRALYFDVDQTNFRDIAELYHTDLEGCAFGMVWDALQDNGTAGKKAGKPRGWWCDSVMLIDCEKANKWIQTPEKIASWQGSYKWHFPENMGCPHKEKTDGIVKEINYRWNCFDGRKTSEPVASLKSEDQSDVPMSEIWHLHWTTISSQPWHPKYQISGNLEHHRKDLCAELWKLAKIVHQIGNVNDY